MNVTRSSKMLAPLPQITQHRTSEVCDLGKLIIYKNLKMLIARSVNARLSCLSIRSSKCFVSEFLAGCLQWKTNSCCIAFTRIHPPPPSPLLCWEQFVLTKFEVITALLLKDTFLCFHHQIQLAQRLTETEDENITIPYPPSTCLPVDTV
jgi:hypothetical protein